jgi:hypothetical protein
VEQKRLALHRLTCEHRVPTLAQSKFLPLGSSKRQPKTTTTYRYFIALLPPHIVFKVP